MNLDFENIKFNIDNGLMKRLKDLNQIESFIFSLKP